MAGADAVYDAAFRQCGAIRVKTIEEMIDLCTLFVNFPKMDGNRVIIVTNSGGPGVLAADMGEEVGLNIKEVSPEAIATLKTFLPPFCGFRNPIDLTVEGTEDGYRKTLLTTLEEYDAAIAMNICPPYLDASLLAKGVADAAELSGKPIVANFLPNQVVHESVKFLKERGVPNFPSGERATIALNKMAKYYEMQRTIGEEKSFTRTWETLRTKLNQEPEKLPGSERMLEPEAMEWLRQNGISVPEFRFVTDEKDVAAACKVIGYPCVMKVVSPQIIHKSEYGGVIVGIKDEAAALKAFETIRARAEGKDFRGVVIYPMIKGGQEVLLGLTVDPQFGPVIVFGLGGINTEIMRDIALSVAPVNHAKALEMINSIKGARLLQGFRGSKPSDLEALADAIVKFSELPFIYPEIAEADLNPVFVMPEGLVVGDVRIIKK